MKKNYTYSSTPSFLIVVCIFSLLTFISSCSIEKRIYRSGYSVDWKKIEAHSDFQTNSPSLENKKETVVKEEISSASLSSTGSSTTLCNEPIKKIKQDATYVSSSPDSTDCDIIILENGTEIKVKIKDIGTNEITYTKCEDDSSTLHSVKIDDVSQVKIHKNSVEANSRPQSKEYVSPKIEPLGLAGFICSVIPFIFPLGGLLGIIFGAISLKKINRNPNKYKGKGFAIAGLIIGIIQLASIVALITILILFL